MRIDIDVVTGALVTMLLFATTAAFMLGVLGEIGVLRRARCPECDRHVLRLPGGEDHACAVCRHDHLAHPMRTVLHPVQELTRR